MFGWDLKNDEYSWRSAYKLELKVQMMSCTTQFVFDLALENEIKLQKYI